MMAATLLGCSGLAAQAQSAESIVDTNLFLPALWDKLVSLRTGVGYRDNILLSHFAPEASPFFAGGAEIMVNRIALEGPQVTIFGSADVNQFLDSTNRDNETIAFARAQVKQPFSDRFEGSLAGDYLFQDEVLDVSITETNRNAVPAVGNTVAFRPGAAFDLSRQFFTDLDASVTRQFFHAPLDNYWEGGLKPTCGFRYGHRSEITISYEPGWRSYDTDAALDAEGQPMGSTTRAYFFQDVRLIQRHYWDTGRHWRTTFKLGFKDNRDNGGGYFDYQRYSTGLQLRYRDKNWDLWAEGRVSFYHYSTQTVSATDPALRKRADVVVTVNFERRLTRFLKFIATYEYQNALSNDPIETYTVNTVTGSLQWEF